MDKDKLVEALEYTENATCAIRQEGAHWRHFHDGGDHPGLFLDADTARWGCNVTPNDAVEINKTRLIDKGDVSAAICKRYASGIETEGQDGATRLGAKHESPTAESGDAQPLEPKD